MAEIAFSAELFEWRGPAPFYFLAVPPAGSSRLHALSGMLTYGWGMIPVTARVREVTWTTSLWPKDGGYVLPVKAAARQAARLELGDLVDAVLVTQGSEHEVDREALVDLVRRLRAGEATTEEQEEAWFAELAAAVPHPRAIDLVLYPEIEVGQDATPSQIVDAALSYRG